MQSDFRNSKQLYPAWHILQLLMFHFQDLFLTLELHQVEQGIFLSFLHLPGSVTLPSQKYFYLQNLPIQLQDLYHFRL